MGSFSVRSTRIFWHPINARRVGREEGRTNWMDRNHWHCRVHGFYEATENERALRHSARKRRKILLGDRNPRKPWGNRPKLLPIRLFLPRKGQTYPPFPSSASRYNGRLDAFRHPPNPRKNIFAGIHSSSPFSFYLLLLFFFLSFLFYFFIFLLPLENVRLQARNLKILY